MATTSRQTAIFGTEDWKKIYKTYKEADLQSYNFETLRKTFVDHLRQNHPESFNDFTENSEYVALLNVIAFMGQSLSFRNDLNTRENFLDTAERRDSVNNLAKLISYTPKRNESATGYLKILAVSTTENITDYNRNNLGNVTIQWNDKTNADWQEQFTTVLNSAIVGSQRIGQPGLTTDILGVKTDEYAINVADGFLPVVPFTATVDGVSMDFEVVNGTAANKSYIYEPAPKVNGVLNMLYRNDNQGYASANTGYFFYFKQGALQTHDFTITEQVANRSVDINIDGINNNDVWLYKVDTANAAVSDQWLEVENIYSLESSQRSITDRKFFSVTSRVSDQITLNFGDGVFSSIPVGAYRSYLRSSNGLEYVINPEEIKNQEITFSYISRRGRSEQLTVTVGLLSAVSNAKNRESLADIKRRAPARYYTQNRMVNGEDYNNFPYSNFSSIIKSKALNRTNVGASRYLDLVDPTGKYSSINAFGSDGLLYNDNTLKTFMFTFNNKNDIDAIFKNKVEPQLASRGSVQFYYNQFSRISLSSGIFWERSSSITNETTGYFKNDANNPLSIGSYVNDNRQYLVNNALVKFVAPAGSHFNANNKIVVGSPTTPTDKDVIWTTLINVNLDGTNFGVGNLEDGTGPVTINNYVPTGAIPVEIIPVFNADIPVAIEQEMLTQVELLRDFGIGFDHLNNKWYIILGVNLDANGEFSLSYAQSQSNANNDASWLIKFSSTPAGYKVSSRTLQYFFSSILETRFFYDGARQIFDPKTGKIVNDFIKVLKTNSKPDAHESLAGDVILDIIGQSVESDGYVNDYKVEVSFTDSDNDGIADNPDFFNMLVAEDVNTHLKNVYFQSTVDFDNLERFLPIASSTINAEYATEAAIGIAKTEHVVGQIFYAYTEAKFFELALDSSSRRVLLARNDYRSEIGRDNIHFQYRHNSPETRRINPGTTNIIDLFVVTSSYYEAFAHYVQDSTGTVAEPAVPTTDELTVQYESLHDKKMLSDNIVLSSVRFKPLFGDKAAEQLQSLIKVVRVPNTATSDSEIKSRAVAAINEYFNIDNWDFGDTFYFSELSSYLHKQIGDVVGSIVIMPKDPTKKFGELYEIKSAPFEIFTSAATVNDVVIIDSLNASELQNGAG
jgi:hypothetical protein